MSEKIAGELEIDHNRGVIYFHDKHTGATVLRISEIPSPIPRIIEDNNPIPNCIDITFGYGVISWQSVDFRLIGKQSGGKRSLESLDPQKVRNLAKETRRQASNARKESETAMFFWDDEADGLYLLSAALEECDDRSMERAYVGLEERTQDLLWEKCLS